MNYDIRKLQGNEIIVFKKMIDKYSDYDKIDLLVHKTLKSCGVSKETFKFRNVNKKKEEPVIIVRQEADELNKFCDGDSCELPFMKGC